MSACYRITLSLCGLGLLLASCGGTHLRDNSASKPMTVGLAVPPTYQVACADEGPACAPGAHGTIPAILRRPPRFPKMRRGGRCPTTTGVSISTKYFGGYAFGAGPVRALVDNAGDLRHGVVMLGYDPSLPGWQSLKTHWFSVPSYSGPFVVHVARLDGATRVAQGPSPQASPLVVPPGPTVNGGNGWREVPYPTYMKAPGCYAWAIEGLGFHELVVLRALRHQ